MGLELYSNRPQDTLNGGIDNVTTTVVLNDASEFSSGTGQYQIIVDDEIMKVTSRSSNTLTVVRAQEGTAAVSHSSGATVSQVLTASSLIRVGTNVHRTDAYGSKPAAGVEGRLFLPNDGMVIERDDGAAWSSWGPSFPFVKPLAADYALINPGSSTLTDGNGGLHLKGVATGSGANIVLAKKAAPSPPYVITAYFLPLTFKKQWHSYGLLWRQSSDGKLAMFDIANEGTNLFARTTKFNTATSFNSDYQTINVPGHCNWMRIVDDNVNREAYLSADGEHWTRFHQVTRLDFLTPDEVGFCVGTENAATPNFDVLLTVTSWKQT